MFHLRYSLTMILSCSRMLPQNWPLDKKTELPEQRCYSLVFISIISVAMSRSLGYVFVSRVPISFQCQQ